MWKVWRSFSSRFLPISPFCLIPDYSNIPFKFIPDLPVFFVALVCFASRKYLPPGFDSFFLFPWTHTYTHKHEIKIKLSKKTKKREIKLYFELIFIYIFFVHRPRRCRRLRLVLHAFLYFFLSFPFIAIHSFSIYTHLSSSWSTPFSPILSCVQSDQTTN